MLTCDKGPEVCAGKSRIQLAGESPVIQGELGPVCGESCAAEGQRSPG